MSSKRESEVVETREAAKRRKTSVEVSPNEIVSKVDNPNPNPGDDKSQRNASSSQSVVPAEIVIKSIEPPQDLLNAKSAPYTTKVLLKWLAGLVGNYSRITDHGLDRVLSTLKFNLPKVTQLHNFTNCLADLHGSSELLGTTSHPKLHRVITYGKYCLVTEMWRTKTAEQIRAVYMNASTSLRGDAVLNAAADSALGKSEEVLEWPEKLGEMSRKLKETVNQKRFAVSHQKTVATWKQLVNQVIKNKNTPEEKQDEAKFPSGANNKLESLFEAPGESFVAVDVLMRNLVTLEEAIRDHEFKQVVGSLKEIANVVLEVTSDPLPKDSALIKPPLVAEASEKVKFAFAECVKADQDLKKKTLERLRTKTSKNLGRPEKLKELLPEIAKLLEVFDQKSPRRSTMDWRENLKLMQEIVAAISDYNGENNLRKAFSDVKARNKCWSIKIGKAVFAELSRKDGEELKELTKETPEHKEKLKSVARYSYLDVQAFVGMCKLGKDCEEFQTGHKELDPKEDGEYL